MTGDLRNDARTCEVRDTGLTQARSPAVRNLPRGFTYFVRDGDMVKIGSSMRPQDRISTLQTGSSRPLEVLAIVSQEIADEFGTHQLFAHLRVRGEWFRADRELLYFIEGVKADAVKLPAPAVVTLPAAIPAPNPALAEHAMMRHLTKLRNAHGARSPMGYACSNVMQGLENLRTYVRPEWATDERQTLPYLIMQQTRRIAELKRASH